MSEALEAEQKTNPQGDPITSVAAPKVGRQRKILMRKRRRQKVVTPEYMFLEAPRTKEFITGSEAAKEADSPIQRRSGCCLSHHAAERNDAADRRAVWRRLCEGILPR